MANELTPGVRRLDETEPHLFAAGDYGRYRETWYGRCPDGRLANLSAHRVDEHEDGTVTVRPSILCGTRDGPHWHGYLERGVWRAV